MDQLALVALQPAVVPLICLLVARVPEARGVVLIAKCRAHLLQAAQHRHHQALPLLQVVLPVKLGMAVRVLRQVSLLVLFWQAYSLS